MFGCLLFLSCFFLSPLSILIDKRQSFKKRKKMKLLMKKINEKDGSGSVALIAQDAEDLWHLYQLITVGDEVTMKTVRRVQKESAVSIDSEVVFVFFLFFFFILFLLLFVFDNNGLTTLFFCNVYNRKRK